MGDIRGGCIGKCCERFFLPYSPMELDREYRNKASLSRGVRIDDQVVLDVEVFAPLVVYLEYSDLDYNGNHVGSFGHWYTCRWFDTRHRLCKAYEHRPDICSGYPYGKRCQYPGCSKGDK
jgi:Fe-S-cluster containining protein